MTGILARFGIALLLAAAAFPARGVTIKLGSIAPAGSPWDDALRQLVSEWTTLSAGAVAVKVYPGGIAGDEDDMIRKMRIGQLDAAGLSGMGLSRIYSGILAVQLPLLVRTNDELNFVLQRMKPRFEQALDAKGYRVVMWNNAGWAYFFSKRPVVTPDDLRAHKLFNIAGDADGIQAWKDAGFHPVPLALTDLTTGLQGGMVDAFTMTPLSTASFQWFGFTPNMCGMKWAPLIGGFVVTTRVWQQIKPELREKLLTATAAIGDSLQKRINGADEQAVDVMKQRGLKVHPVPADVERQWKAATEKGFSQIAGKSFDIESFELVKQYLDEYRRSNGR